MKKSDLTRRANNAARRVYQREGFGNPGSYGDGFEAGYRANLRRQLGVDAKSAMIGSASAFRIGIMVRKWLRPIG